MRKSGIAAVAFSAALSASAVAEDWTTVQTSPAFSQDLGGFTNFQPVYDGGTVRGGESVFVTCTLSTMAAAYPATASNCDPHNLGRMIPIFEFARASSLVSAQGQVTSLNNRVGALETTVGSLATSASVSALGARVTSAEGQLAAMQQDLNALSTYIPEAMQDMQQEARAGAAMAASLETIAPAPGSKNRLGFNSASYNGETAFSVSYVRQEGQIDVSAGVAISGDEALVKGGVGLSW